MSEKRQIFCDQCDSEISPGVGSLRYYLELRAVGFQKLGGPANELFVPPPIDGVKQLCSSGCLAAWLRQKE
jgi:hypothetical protein